MFLRVADGRVLYDLQSRASLDRYLDHFDALILAMPRLSESHAVEFSAKKNFVWVPVDDLADRVQFVPLPEPTSVTAFLRDYRPTARLLRRCIDAVRYIQCAPSGVVNSPVPVAPGRR